ncbi:MAG: glycoside hydrolase family 127 protein [Anaerolineae bacterium]|nr:glycoside hydrolase family 127 protein [Anaerolineae bacterium]
MTSLETDSLRLACLEEGGQITGFTLEVRGSSGWQQVAKTTPLSHLIYKDKAGERHETALNAQEWDATDSALKLSGTMTDVDGTNWQLSVKFSKTDSPYQFQADYQLKPDQNAQVFRWLGPCLYAGEGSFGSGKSEALFPGLEYLLDDEPSSDTRFAAEKYANRTVPHPYRVTVPLMAVSCDEQAVGLLWDPNQAWGSAWRHPSSLFSSPNRLQDGAENHWMALFTPGGGERHITEGKTEGEKGNGISPTNPHTLSAQLVAVPEGGVMGIMRQWMETYGLPPLPDGGQSYRENVELCIDSYLNIAWDDEAEGWHHTLADPWGPRFEPILANQLWRYSRWSQGDPVKQARARDQVRRAIPRLFEKHAAPHNVPRIELALTFGKVAQSLEGAAQAVKELISEQQADGSWGWTPEAIADIGEFKTKDRIALMGKEQDSATGYTGSKVIPVLQYALITGDAEAVESVIKAADWCNTQRRPEGAQTWELHLHVPDVLAAPYLINLNLGAYELTGDSKYLDHANYWAWTGLVFTFLWNPYYRPIMRYGTIPVFGVTFHDVQSWFGVIVHWNGLWYADSLFRLAQYTRTDGPIDWYQLAEGITRHGIQEQAKEGPYLGMFPDAFSTVHGDEEYTWWLNPQLVGLNTLPLAGLPLLSEPQLVKSGDQITHITSGATITHVQDNRVLRLVLQDQPNATSFTLIAHRGKPQSITSEGKALAQVDDVEAVDEGWQWLASQKAALVKTRSGAGAITLVCQFAE